jgi:hypothetical protein
MSVEFAVLKALKKGGAADTYAIECATNDGGEDDTEGMATRLVCMEGLGVVERLDETMMSPTEWAITPQGLKLLKAQA